MKENGKAHIRKMKAPRPRTGSVSDFRQPSWWVLIHTPKPITPTAKSCTVNKWSELPAHSNRTPQISVLSLRFSAYIFTPHITRATHSFWKLELENFKVMPEMAKKWAERSYFLLLQNLTWARALKLNTHRR